MRTGLLLVAVLATACTEERAAVTGTQSLAIKLVAPTDPCPAAGPLADTARTVTFDVTALNEKNEKDTTFDTDVQVYAQFLGTLTPSFGSMPLLTFHVTAGAATGQTITLPNVFGPTVIWVDDGSGIGSDYIPGRVTGTSDVLCYRDPFIADLQTPRDEMALDALTATPLQDKQIGVNASRYGARGRLVVNSVFSQGYTVSDVQCADPAGNPPCTYQSYDHALIFSFSAPRDQHGNNIEQGMVIAGFAGGQSEFNGLTEIGFPQTFTPVDAMGNSILDVNLGRLPAPAVFDVKWFNGLSDPLGEINFERNEAAPIEIRNAKVCDLDDKFITFKQWKIDPTGTGGDCSSNDNVLSVITAGTISDLDPATLVGKTLPRVVGVLRPVEIGSFNVWIIFPRSMSDLTLQ
jgi:hypothetical protein